MHNTYTHSHIHKHKYTHAYSPRALVLVLPPVDEALLRKEINRYHDYECVLRNTEVRCCRHTQYRNDNP